VCIDGGAVEGRSGIGDLRALIVSDAGLDVEDALGAEFEDVGQFIEHEALADVAPMAEIDGEFEIGNLP
jgi:hypothetical protein